MWCSSLRAAGTSEAWRSWCATNVDRLALVQISDYELGTLDTPNRSVIGDGDIPLERLLGVLLDAGYEG